MKKSDEKKSNSSAKQSWIDGQVDFWNQVNKKNNHDKELQALREQYRKLECILDQKGKYAIDSLFLFIEAHPSDDIENLAIRANESVLLLDYHIDLPLPYDITKRLVNAVTNFAAIEEARKNSIAWIREILKTYSQNQQQNLNNAASEKEAKPKDLISTAVAVEERGHQITEEWSKPMSKNEMMTRLGIDSYKTFNAWSKTIGIKEAGNRQTFIIRLDEMDKKTRSKLENK